MKRKKVETINLLALFVKKVKKQDLPVRDREKFQEQINANKKNEVKISKLQHAIELIESDLFKAQAGLDKNRCKTLLKKSGELKKELQKYEYYNQVEFNKVFPQEHGPYLPLDSECKDITIRVCQDRVCVAQPVPISVDGIWLETGSNGTFELIGNKRFRHNDEVIGSSSWNLTYHRHSQTHEGKICIWSSTELVEAAKVLGIGIVFNGFEYGNYGCAIGDNKTFVPNSWGRAQMFYQFRVSSKIPGGLWVREYDGSEILYNDTGRIESRIACWSNNVLGNDGSATLSIELSKSFPAGTQFLIEAYLRYWIKANGVDADASVGYSLDVSPYISLESCSYQYPEWITIHVTDYL